MGRFDATKATIDANIKSNGNQEITGDILNSVMKGMVDATDAELTEQSAKLAELSEELNGSQPNYTSGQYLKSDNSNVDDALYGITDFIPYEQGKDVLWRFAAAAGARPYYILFYRSDKSFISGSDYFAQYNAELNGRQIAASSIAIYAKEAAYIRASFDLDFADAEVLVGDVSMWKPQQLEPSLSERINEVNANLNSIDNTLSDFKNISLTLSESGYVYNNGNITQTASARRSDYIQIGSYTNLKWAVNISPSGYAVAFFDKGKKILPDISILGTDSLTSGDVDLTGEEYTNAVYVVLSYYDSTLKFEGYIGELYKQGSIAQIIKTEEKRSCDRNGLNVLIFGDSITTCASITYNANKQTTSYALRSQSNSFVDKDGNTIRFSMWPYLLTEYFNCKDVRNYAESGASYKDATRAAGNERQNLSFQIDLAINDIYNPHGVFPTDEFNPDIIIFALGTNDGAANDTYDSAMAKTITTDKGFDVDATLANLDTSKFCEAARKAFLRVCYAFPYAQKLCVLPIQRETWEQAENGVNAELRKMAERYSMLVIDGAAELGIIRDFEVAGGVGTYLKDGLHPNDKGQQMYTRMVARYIRQCINLDL